MITRYLTLLPYLKSFSNASLINIFFLFYPSVRFNVIMVVSPLVPSWQQLDILDPITLLICAGVVYQSKRQLHTAGIRPDRNTGGGQGVEVPVRRVSGHVQDSCSLPFLSQLLSLWLCPRRCRKGLPRQECECWSGCQLFIRRKHL